MKKILLLLATIAILLMSLTGCGENNKTDDMVSDVESGISSIVSGTESMLGNDSGNVSSNASR